VWQKFLVKEGRRCLSSVSEALGQICQTFIYKAKLTFFPMYCVPVSCSLQTFPVMPGISFYQSKPRGHRKESKLLFPIRYSFFRGNKLLKKQIFFGNIPCTEQNLGLQKLQLRCIKALTDVLWKPWQSATLSNFWSLKFFPVYARPLQGDNSLFRSEWVPIAIFSVPAWLGKFIL